MDDFYGFKAGTTKRIKSKPDSMEDLDDGSGRIPFKTKIFKVFDGVEYKGEVQGYDVKEKLYKIKYEDEDIEDMYHNEVKEYSKGWTLPKHKRWKRKRNQVITNYIHKLAPTERDYDTFTHTLSPQDIRNIASVCRLDLDLTEDEIPDELIRVCINTNF